ncbi:MAG: hypothetical protein ORN24_07020 [Burkholderiales bacterium]|jgi:hypothetical protein|nr:hypothetical protein [Burkholderiales bacterium]
MKSLFKYVALFLTLGVATAYSQAEDLAPNSFYNANYAYILNMKNNSYIKCNVDTNGIEAYTCVTYRPTNESGQPLLSSPDSLAFYGKYAYISNFKSNAITKCLYDADGIESSSCYNVKPVDGSGALLNSASGISFNGNYAYMVNQIESDYVQCSINNDQLNPNDCSLYTPKDESGNLLLTDPMQVKFNNNYAYFDNLNGKSAFTKCQTNEHGIVVNSCKNFSLPYILGSTSALAFNGKQAYFASVDLQTNLILSRCAVESHGIDAGSCIELKMNAVSGTSLPTALNFNNGYVYMTIVGVNMATLKSTGSYLQCQTSESGIRLQSCFSYTSPIFQVPTGIEFSPN